MKLFDGTRLLEEQESIVYDDERHGWRVGDAIYPDHARRYHTVPSKTREELKAERQARVDAIKVTTAAGNTFDGDETSQGRMTRAIIGLNAAGQGATVPWVLADNSVIAATAAELTEALVLAGQAQAAVWVIE